MYFGQMFSIILFDRSWK